MALYSFGSLHHVLHQHGGGHGADAAGNGRDGLNDRLDLVKLGVAGDAALAALGVDLVLVPVDGHVHDHLSGADIVLGQAVQHTGGGNNDVRVPADFSGVHRLGMADGNGGVLAHEHHGGGLADHQAAANDRGVLALAVDTVVVQNLHAGGGGAGGEAQTVQSLKHTGVGQMGHAVHVLPGVEAVADLILVGLQMLGQGTEHQHAVDGIVGVDLIDDRENVFLGRVPGQLKLLDLYAHQLGALGRALFVAEVGGVGAHTDDAQSGDDALLPQRGGTGLQIRVQGIGNFLAQQ